MTDRPRIQLDEAGVAAFAERAGDGPVRMLNLLKFCAGGAALYGRYGAAMQPFLEKAGGRVVLAGRPAELLIGDQTWDLVVVVEYPTRGHLLAMIGSDDYRGVASLRAEALERSVLYALDPVDP